MRRHSENEVQNADRNSSGILVLFLMWVLALMALTTAANGQTIVDDARTDAGAGNGAQHHLPSAQPQDSRSPEASAASAAQSQSSEPITLTRFVLISIPDRQLAFVDNGVVKIYPIAVGASHTPSPQGDFTVISHVANPTWSHRGKVVGPGKSNPVGSRWMGLSLKGYGIHGTNAPRSIGKAASHGCFRMNKRDVEELFTLVKVGDTVAVRAERDELVTQVFGPTNSNSETQVASAVVATTTTGADDE